jgi:hypothetical protein
VTPPLATLLYLVLEVMKYRLYPSRGVSASLR